MTAISQTGFLLRIPQEKQRSTHLPPFSPLFAKKGLKPGMGTQRGEIRDANAEQHELKLWASLDLGRV